MAEGRIKDPHGNQSDDYNFGYIQRINKYWPGEPRRKKVIPFYNPIVDNGNRKFNKNDMFSQRANVHIVSYIFRHNTKMKQKTKDIYVALGDYKYYIDVYRDHWR